MLVRNTFWVITACCAWLALTDWRYLLLAGLSLLAANIAVREGA